MGRLVVVRATRWLPCYLRCAQCHLESRNLPRVVAVAQWRRAIFSRHILLLLLRCTKDHPSPPSRPAVATVAPTWRVEGHLAPRRAKLRLGDKKGRRRSWQRPQAWQCRHGPHPSYNSLSTKLTEIFSNQQGWRLSSQMSTVLDRCN
jgi:hypothetical protein